MTPVPPHRPEEVPQTGQTPSAPPAPPAPPRSIARAAVLLGLVMALLHQHSPAQHTPTAKSANTTTAVTRPATTRAQPTTSSTRTATRPATTAQAVPPPPPPKTIALAFAAAIEKGDVPTAKSLVSPGDLHAKWVDSTIALATSLKKLDSASITRFGELGRKVSQNALGMPEAFKALPQAQETIQGDRATVGALRLRRVGNKWLIEPPAEPQHLARHQKLYALLAAAAERTAAEVAAGQYATPDLAAAAFARRALQARIRAV